MARITVEDCLQNEPNLFNLVLLAAKRARRLANGAEATVEWENDGQVSHSVTDDPARADKPADALLQVLTRAWDETAEAEVPFAEGAACGPDGCA